MAVMTTLPPSMPSNPHTDPLTLALLPPPDESPSERMARLQREAEAKRVSDEIDKQLQAEESAAKKRKKPVRLLLLGQSESGKSTTLKNFQLTYARKAWSAERASWKAVIQLNLTRSVNAILDALQDELELLYPTATSNADETGDPIDPARASTISSASALTSASFTSHFSPTLKSILSSSHLNQSSTPSPNTNTQNSSNSPLDPKKLAHYTHLLRTLQPRLRSLQRQLERQLGSEATEISGVEERVVQYPEPQAVYAPDNASTIDGMGMNGNGANALGVNGFGGVNGAGTQTGGSAPPTPRRNQEFFVRSSSNWKSALTRFRTRSSRSGERASSDSSVDVVGETLSSVRDDVKGLWHDSWVRDVIGRRKVGMGDSGGFFLDNLARVTSRNYTPSDDDIVRARLRTVGVQEYNITFETGPESSKTWTLYDVGGSRSSRHAWPPFFDTVNAIIFLAPISAFDQRLAEDPSTLRLDDSLSLWKYVCGSKLLKGVDLVLFLNKCDLLEEKLKRGVVFGRYVRGYGERGNDAESVKRYLRSKFTEMCRHYSPGPRVLHIHLTSVVDTRATADTLSSVQDSILRAHLTRLDLV